MVGQEYLAGNNNCLFSLFTGLEGLNSMFCDPCEFYRLRLIVRRFKKVVSCLFSFVETPRNLVSIDLS